MDKDKSDKTRFTAFPLAFEEKSGELWSTNYGDLDVTHRN